MIGSEHLDVFIATPDLSLPSILDDVFRSRLCFSEDTGECHESSHLRRTANISGRRTKKANSARPPTGTHCSGERKPLVAAPTTAAEDIEAATLTVLARFVLTRPLRLLDMRAEFAASTDHG